MIVVFNVHFNFYLLFDCAEYYLGHRGSLIFAGTCRIQFPDLQVEVSVSCWLSPGIILAHRRANSIPWVMAPSYTFKTSNRS